MKCSISVINKFLSSIKDTQVLENYEMHQAEATTNQLSKSSTELINTAMQKLRPHRLKQVISVSNLQLKHKIKIKENKQRYEEKAYWRLQELQAYPCDLCRFCLSYHKYHVFWRHESTIQTSGWCPQLQLCRLVETPDHRCSISPFLLTYLSSYGRR